MALTTIFNKGTRVLPGANVAASHEDRGMGGKPRLGKMLLEKKWITQEQLEAALLAQMRSPGKKLGEILIEKGFISALKLQSLLDAQMEDVGVANGPVLPPLPADAAEYAVLDNRILYVLAGRQTQMALQSWVAEARRAGLEVTVKTCDMTTLSELRSSTATASHATLPAIRATRRIIAQAVAEKASDVHLTLRRKEDGNGYLRVQFRVNGDVEDRYQLPQSEGEMMIRAMFQGMAAVADAQYQETEDQHAVIANPALLRDEAGNDLGLTGIRLARAPLHDGMNLAARLLYRMDKKEGEDDTVALGQLIRRLGYSQRQVNVLMRLAQSTMGINPFTGPTGSGKSSSLANMIITMLRVRHGVRIITIEDPVEFVFASDYVWQYRIANANTDEEKNRTFSGKLKTSLRQDPDIIMLGEIRGLETAKEAVNAAITGHQVWTTIHVSDPFMIVQRLVAMGIDGFYLQDPKMLSSLIAQRLVKTLCPHCAILATREAMVEAGGAIAGDNWDALMTWVTPEFPAENIRMAHPDGCDHCNHKGNSGRTVVAQVIATDEDLLVQMVTEGPMRARKAYMAHPDAELHMEGHAVLKVLAGMVDPRSVVDALGPILPRPADLRPLTREDL